MDDAPFMCRLECLGDLFCVAESGLKWKRPSKSLTLHQLHRECLDAVRFFDPVNRGDVAMIQRGESSCFTLEAAYPLGILCVGRRQGLDRNFPIELRVSCSIHLAHAALANGRKNLVGANAVTYRESHLRIHISVLDREGIVP